MDIQTPNGLDFSAAAKAYLCAGRLLAPGGGMYFGYMTAQGSKVDFRILGKGIALVTVESLESTGFAQFTPFEKKLLLGKVPTLMVHAVYSGAVGFSGRFLEATHWVDTDLVAVFDNLMSREESPIQGFLAKAAHEFVDAGIFTSGSHLGGGGVWNTEWLTYLQEAWMPEAYEIWQRAWARPDQEAVVRSFMTAVAGNQYTPDND
jgi:hypothetical protein